MTLLVGRGLSKTSRKLIGTQRFDNQPWNLTFEKTPYMWYFDIVVIEQRRYNHAWSDSLVDFLVPEGECHTICAPASFVKQWNLEQELKRQRNASQIEQNQCINALQKHAQPLATMYFGEAQQSLFGSVFYANKWSFSDLNPPEISTARKLAQGAIAYYHSAIDIAESVNLGSAMEIASSFLIPGGVENLQAFADGAIDGVRFLSKIGTDLGQDFAASLATGGFGGFANRIRKATVGTASVTFRKGLKIGVTERAVRLFGQGRFWEKLFDHTAVKWGGEVKKWRKRSKKKLKFDSDGFAYEFDQAHKTDKIHLHKY